MKRFNILSILFLFCLMLLRPAGKESADSLLIQAESFFSEALAQAEKEKEAAYPLFEKSAIIYEKLVHENKIRNGYIFYNLANTYYFMENYGKALLNYKRAQVYLPLNEDIINNINYLKSRTGSTFEESIEQKIFKILLFWHYAASLKFKIIIFLTSYLIAWFLICLLIYKPKNKYKFFGTLFIIAAIIFYSSFYIQKNSLFKSGVIIEENIIARKGDSLIYNPAFTEPLKAGTEFRLLEERSGWYYIQLENKEKAWIPASSGELVKL